MPRRTAMAIKAVRDAWDNEKTLVEEGKGTRDWTPDQQRDILEKGKAYDENGKAFEGHHQKSVEKYPEYQGDAENIQFLSRDEHYAAHGGSFQNPTNGYYDPVTGETKDFGDGKYESCQVIELSEPIVVRRIENRSTEDIVKHPTQPAQEEATIPRATSQSDNRNNTYNQRTKPTNQPLVVSSKSSFWSKAWSGVKDAAKHSIRWVVTHPGETISAIFTGIEVFSAIKSSSSTSSGSIGTQNTKSSSCTSTKAEPSTVTQKPIITSDTVENIVEETVKRASPKAHEVSGYHRTRFGKDEFVPSYPRGGKDKKD